MNAPEPKKRLVWLHWLDSCVHDGGWANEALANGQKPLFVESAGILIAESKYHMTITCSAVENGQRLAPMTIPKCAILDRGELSPVKRHGRRK